MMSRRRGTITQHDTVAPEPGHKSDHNFRLCEVPVFSLVACAACDYDPSMRTQN